MKAIVFSSNSREDFPMIHKVTDCENGLIITGCLPNHKWEENQIIEGNHHLIYSKIPHLQPDTLAKSRFLKINKVIEQRDHAGRFTKPEFKENSFFKLQLEFLDLQDPILNEIE